MTIATIFPAITTTVVTGGIPVVAITGPLSAALITNPVSAADQGLALAETLFIDLVGPAHTSETATTFPLAPGASFTIPPGFVGNVSVNAQSSGHRFSAYVVHGVAPFTPFDGVFPPDGPTSLTKTIASYLYQEYSDDDDLQAFVDAYNTIVQQYVDWFNAINLPVYTGPLIVGALLDWVAEGLYGITRPFLPSGLSKDIGPLNTWVMNTIPLNVQRIVGPPGFFATSDDVFKRVITWHFGKGDGKIFNIRWLKRRIMRFLLGTNGVWINPDQTYQVSVTFGTGHQVNINLTSTFRRATGGAILNTGPLNTWVLNEIDTVTFMIPISQLAPIFKAAVDAGVLELPFQFTWVVNIES